MEIKVGDKTGNYTQLLTESYYRFNMQFYGSNVEEQERDIYVSAKYIEQIKPLIQYFEMLNRLGEKESYDDARFVFDVVFCSKYNKGKGENYKLEPVYWRFDDVYNTFITLVDENLFDTFNDNYEKYKDSKDEYVKKYHNEIEEKYEEYRKKLNPLNIQFERVIQNTAFGSESPDIKRVDFYFVNSDREERLVDFKLEENEILTF